MRIREALPEDFAAILRLNEESVHFLSPLDESGLAALHAQAAYRRVAEEPGRVAGFLLALREGADYGSPNYRWFMAHYASFLYVDRVVVSRQDQGRGVGRLLYADLFDFARASGAPRITLEYDVEPPNPQSRRFHERFGFQEVGSQRVGPSQKVVSLQAAEL